MKTVAFFLVFMITSLSCKNSYLKTPPQDSINTKEVEKPKVTYNTDSTTVKFKGVITNIKYDCRVDGLCSIEVNDKWRIAIIYGKRDPSRIPKERGVVTGIQFFPVDKEIIGKKVTVYAKIKENKNQLTLEGSKEYYVKVIE